MTDYLDRIKNYIFDSRFTRALLIDGYWGCGKSYYVKNTLIPSIEKIKIKDIKGSSDSSVQEKDCNEHYYKTLLISLYGISKIENIQAAIYTACLEKITDKTKNEKTNTILRNAVILGVTAIKGVGSYFNVGNEAGDLINKLGEGVLSPNRENTILILDDIERCQIDIIELMGFLNNLCENNRYRVILIANEKEIERRENEVARAIQSQTAWFDLCLKQFNCLIEEKNESTNNIRGRSSQDHIIEELQNSRKAFKDDTFMNQLEEHRGKLFERNTLYERTREKLIGLTIRFESRLGEVYDDILRNTIAEGEIRDFLTDRKEFVVEGFSSQDHENLRTLVSLFIAVEAVFSVVDIKVSYEYEKLIDIDSIISDENERLLQYLIHTAIGKANGETFIKLGEGVRYGTVSKGVFDSQKQWFRYAFVDEYWDTLVVNAAVAIEDVNNHVNEVISDAIERVRNKKHFDLSLYRLKEWYFHPDDEVKADVEKLKEELKAKKYYPNEFKDIIYILMCLNNTQYGMKFDSNNDYNTSNRIFDSIDDAFFSAQILNDESEKTANSGITSDQINLEYSPWPQINIDEYIKLMLRYTKDEQFYIDKEMLRLITGDINMAKQYRRYIQPMLDWINERDLDNLKKSEEGIELLELDTGKLHSAFHNKRDTFMTNKQFLSLYGYDIIEKKIRESSARDLKNIADAIHTVYNFGNLRDFFSKDYDTVNKVWIDLKKDRENNRVEFNPEKSRTREIALRRLETDFEKYRNTLRDPNIIIEERIRAKQEQEA